MSFDTAKAIINSRGRQIRDENCNCSLCQQQQYRERTETVKRFLADQPAARTNVINLNRSWK